MLHSLLLYLYIVKKITCEIINEKFGFKYITAFTITCHMLTILYKAKYLPYVHYLYLFAE